MRKSWLYFAMRSERDIDPVLICVARVAGFVRIEGDVLTENTAIHRLLMELGFRFVRHPDGAYLGRVTKRLIRGTEVHATDGAGKAIEARTANRRKDVGWVTFSRWRE